MHSATEILRDQAFRPLECEVPADQTLREWGAQRAARASRRRRLRMRLRRTPR